MQYLISNSIIYALTYETYLVLLFFIIKRYRGKPVVSQQPKYNSDMPSELL